MANFERENKAGDAVLQHDQSTGPGSSSINPAGVFPEAGETGAAAAPSGSMPGSGPPDHHGDVRGVFGNPQVFKDTFSRLSSAFTEAINKIEDESGSGVGNTGQALIGRLLAMQGEVDSWRAGKGLEGISEDGQDVVGAEGGLYKE
ncbi:hypothetical protein B9479_000047 [Cryptococcus floricola]|uniref:Uncharacterized protein n=1 Tax=Cryptococcus floricola TaxID=2591691 RepID=A0A5D3B7S9_9TREE|nr:hypothetical protein B9479_000047 [Cryptococcus floricola]